MKSFKIQVLILIIAIFSLVPFSDIFGCTVSIVPSKTEVEVGDIISVDILRTQTHKTCVLPLDETKIEISGGEIITDYPWVEGTPDKKTIEVKFTTVGDSIIKVIRDCPKSGLMVWTSTIKVVESSSKSDNSGSYETPPSTSDSTSSESVSSNASSEISETEKTSTAQSSAIIETKQSEEKSSNSSALLGRIFSTQNILYIALLVLALILFVLKKFKIRYLVLLFSLAVLGFYFGGCPCPMGFIEKIFLNQVGSSVFIATVVLLSVITLITLFKGRIFCGWVCPHGALQEFLYQKKIAIKISPNIDKKLKYLKYLVLILVVFLAIATGEGVLCKFEPFKSIYNLSAAGIGLVLVILTLVSSLFIYRPWCRYICPFGAYLGIVSFVREKLHLINGKIANTCVLCKNCQKTCPANSIVDKGDHFEIDCKECFNCGDCVSCCPKNK